MNAQTSLDTTQRINKLAKAASELGFEIVDIDGFFGLVESHANQQRNALNELLSSVKEMASANKDAAEIAQNMRQTSQQAQQDIAASATLVRTFSDKTKDMAGWVTSVRDRSATVGDTVRAVKNNNTQIASIATQVNTLAINAKIEAARAGDAGRGFAVVANAINELSQKTSTAARQISENIESLSNWITDLGREAVDVAEAAHGVLKESAQTDKALHQMEETSALEHKQAERISVQTERGQRAMDILRPAVRNIDRTVKDTTRGVAVMHERMSNLISSSELIVQLTAGLGGATADAPLIDLVQHTAQQISQGLEAAIKRGQITQSQLFDTDYIPVPGSNPVQVTSRATPFLDNFLPSFQEPVLMHDNGIVFCASVDTNGYLPVHNAKFSQPQTSDVVWNTANSRNRRIFDDRVGLKAGRNTAPFLLQVYRRDMGGGIFRVMKDLSAPIHVNAKHWGGLRLAYAT